MSNDAPAPDATVEPQKSHRCINCRFSVLVPFQVDDHDMSARFCENAESPFDNDVVGNSGTCDKFEMRGTE